MKTPKGVSKKRQNGLADCTPPSTTAYSSTARPTYRSLLGSTTLLQRTFLVLLSTSLALRGIGAYVYAEDPDREKNPIQSIADGTQDLAALIGVFCTDSVEAHAVDFTRGIISTAASLCSLLGILGYVRALAKLALGAEACRNSAFSTVHLRTIFGVEPQDAVPSNEQSAVFYIQKSENGASVRYTIEKAVNHTYETSKHFGRIRELRNPGVHIWTGIDYYVNRKRIGFEKGRISRARYAQSVHLGDKISYRLILQGSLSIICASAATSLPILMVRGNQGFDWIRGMASFGLLSASTLSAILWTWVYYKEQYPGKLGVTRFLESSNFAVIRSHESPNVFCIANVSAVSFQLKGAITALTVFFAMLITLGYICQYLELKKATSTISAWWLASQAILAVIRILLWVQNIRVEPIPHLVSRKQQIQPNIDPSIIAISSLEIHTVQSFSGVHLRRGLPIMDVPKALYIRFQTTALADILQNTLMILDGKTAPTALKNGALQSKPSQLLVWWYGTGGFFDWLELIYNSQQTPSRAGVPQVPELKELKQNPEKRFGFVIVGAGKGDWGERELFLIPTMRAKDATNHVVVSGNAQFRLAFRPPFFEEFVALDPDFKPGPFYDSFELRELGDLYEDYRKRIMDALQRILSGLEAGESQTNRDSPAKGTAAGTSQELQRRSSSPAGDVVVNVGDS